MRASECYAEALFAAAEDLDAIRAVRGELQDLAALCARWSWYLNDPRTGPEEKARAMGELLGDQAHPLTLQFFLLLLRRRHLKHLPAAAERYGRICDQRDGHVTVRLRVPYPLEAGLLEQLKRRLAEKGLISGERPDQTEFQIQLDKELIGGFIAESNGMQIDASVKSALTRLHTG